MRRPGLSASPKGSPSRMRPGRMQFGAQQDAHVGIRGQILFPDSRWFIPYYFDIGTGESKLTWQALVGVGYSFDWGEVTLAMRSLSYDFDKDNADLTLTGPGLGVGFRW
jgi:hypothetical protein